MISSSVSLSSTFYGGPGGRATRRCLCDDDDAPIDDDDATIDDDDATIDDGDATIDDGDATIDDGDAIIYQVSNTVITHARAPDRTPHHALIYSTWPCVIKCEEQRNCELKSGRETCGTLSWRGERASGREH